MITGSPNRLDELLVKSIDELGLSKRARECFVSENIQTIGEICEFSETGLLTISGLGEKTVNEIKEKLRKFDPCLCLGMLPLNMRSSYPVWYNKKKKGPRLTGHWILDPGFHRLARGMYASDEEFEAEQQKLRQIILDN